MQKKLIIVVGVVIGFLLLINQSYGLHSNSLSQTPTVTIQPTATATPTTTPTPTSGLSNNNYYINSSGNEVHSPAYSNSAPAGATAICRDGTYSFSQHRRGTCSYHGGVAQWL